MILSRFRYRPWKLQSLDYMSLGQPATAHTNKIPRNMEDLFFSFSTHGKVSELHTCKLLLGNEKGLGNSLNIETFSTFTSFNFLPNV